MQIKTWYDEGCELDSMPVILKRNLAQLNTYVDQKMFMSGFKSVLNLSGPNWDQVNAWYEDGMKLNTFPVFLMQSMTEELNSFTRGFTEFVNDFSRRGK